MRYLETQTIVQANNLISKITSTNYNLNFDIFTCKYTKKQKKILRSKGKFSHLINSLKMCFPELKTKNIKASDFSETEIDKIKEHIEIKYQFSPIENKNVSSFKNWNFSEESIDNYSFSLIFDFVIKKEIGTKNFECFQFEKRIVPFEENMETMCYLIYVKEKKRVLIVSRTLNEDFD